MDVLLVDDHPIIHETMRSIVRSVRADARFHSQFDLSGGLAQAHRLDDLRLILVDLGLPGCSGLQALDKFREAFPDTPVAVISAEESEERVLAALDAGAVGYLPKTLLPRAMAGAVQTILEGRIYSPLPYGKPGP